MVAFLIIISIFALFIGSFYYFFFTVSGVNICKLVNDKSLFKRTVLELAENKDKILYYSRLDLFIEYRTFPSLDCLNKIENVIKRDFPNRNFKLEFSSEHLQITFIKK